MDDQTIRKLADELFAARRNLGTVPPLTRRYPAIGIDDAYRISLAQLELRKAAGETVIGKKIGVTSAAVQKQLEVYQPDFGFLTGAMEVPSGGEIPLKKLLIQPRVEAEIAIRLARDLDTSGVTRGDVHAAVDSVRPCIEIVDSRIEDWKIRIEDTIADNASCGAFVLGPETEYTDDLELDAVSAEFLINGKVVSTGVGSNIIGSPLGSIQWLANTLGAYGVALRAGDIVLTGALVPLEAINRGDTVCARLAALGECTVRFT